MENLDDASESEEDDDGGRGGDGPDDPFMARGLKAEGKMSARAGRQAAKLGDDEEDADQQGADGLAFGKAPPGLSMDGLRRRNIAQISAGQVSATHRRRAMFAVADDEDEHTAHKARTGSPPSGRGGSPAGGKRASSPMGGKAALQQQVSADELADQGLAGISGLAGFGGDEGGDGAGSEKSSESASEGVSVSEISASVVGGGGGAMDHSG